jgi:hypothetical protein
MEGGKEGLNIVCLFGRLDKKEEVDLDYIIYPTNPETVQTASTL